MCNPRNQHTSIYNDHKIIIIIIISANGGTSLLFESTPVYPDPGIQAIDQFSNKIYFIG